ncbi:MAG: B-box zinc finger protein [Candidatus Acidiferrales bacterium]
MNCAAHADVEATGYCRNCGKALCPECTRDVRGALYCENCLAGMVASAPAQPAGQLPGQAATQTDVHPGLAAVLAFIPGLGAVYNGEYVKALIHVLIFGGLIASLSSDVNGEYKVFIAIALGCFYCYMPVDAYRVANARRTGRPEEAGPLGETPVMGRSGAPIGAFVLIFLGVMFLLANFGLLNEDWLAKAWPLGLIGIGVWTLWQRMSRKNS